MLKVASSSYATYKLPTSFINGQGPVRWNVRRGLRCHLSAPALFNLLYLR